MLCRFFIFILCGVVLFASPLWACESCTLSRLGRGEGLLTTESTDKKWFVEYLYENQNWHEKDAGEAHAIHHQGHHVHDKTFEELHHFGVGRRVNERVTLTAQVPYVVRHSLEVDNHAILGAPQKSMGLGDLQLTTDYRLINAPAGSLSLLGGIKFPTGATKESNSAGARFEPELQPGSGSYDYLLGAALRRSEDRLGYAGNLAYVLRTQGAQEFRFGDVASTSLIVDYRLTPEEGPWQTRAGLDGNLQFERHQREDGVTVKDSGGWTMLVGPVVSVQKGSNVSLSATFLAPVLQDLGGVHQKLDYVWTLANTLRW